MFKRLSLLSLFFAAFTFAQTPEPTQGPEPTQVPATSQEVEPAKAPEPIQVPAPSQEAPALETAKAAEPAKAPEPSRETPVIETAKAPTSLNEPGDKSSTVSVFVKNPAEIKALQEDLRNLQVMAGGSNPEIEALMKRANRIAEMNDRCASISLNDLLDSTCGRFYEVELPAFENEFMELTGEIRLGSMRMATTLEERTRQLASCSEALTSIVMGREQMLRLHGNVFLEPINFAGDFDAEYRFSLTYDQTRLDQQKRLADLWIEKCGSIVLRQSGEEFAPMFVATLKMKNDSLKKAGSNVKFMMSKKGLSLRVDMRRPMHGAYYMNGIRMFENTLDASTDNSLLHFQIKEKKASLNTPKNMELKSFKGRQVFKKLKQAEMIGRWVWDSEKLPEQVAVANTTDESETMTKEDSLAYKQGQAELEQAMADKQDSIAAAEKLRKQLEEQAMADEAAAAAAAEASSSSGKSTFLRWLPVAISGALAIGGGVMAFWYDKKAKDVVQEYKDGIGFHLSMDQHWVNNGYSWVDKGYSGNPFTKKESSSKEYYEDRKKLVERHQTLRNVGIGLGAAGLVGVGFFIVF
ncbi:MAG: procyclic acidic repetitive family protein [Fibrobacter sp.]|nr:procyclic acidic repetitive family protein [Fibrobacter sp.]